MTPTARLLIDDLDAVAHGSLDLLETRLVRVHGNLDATAYGTCVAERAAEAVIAHSSSSVLVDDGPGVSAAALEFMRAAAPRRLVVLARRGITGWHESLADLGALVLQGHHAALCDRLSDAVLVVEQHHSDAPRARHIAAIPGPILAAASAGSNALLLRGDVEIVPDLDAWARRLDYRPMPARSVHHRSVS